MPPSLRKAPEDIPLFVEHFLKEAVEELDRDIDGGAKRLWPVSSSIPGRETSRN